jgi:hypothetical protein
MSDNSTANVSTVSATFDGKTFSFHEVNIPGRKTAKTPNPENESHLEPLLETNEDRGTFVAALLNTAELSKAGSANVLWERMTRKHFRDTSEAIVDSEGVVHPDNIVPAYIATRSGSSLSESALVELKAQYDAEIASVFPIVLAQHADPAEFERLLAEGGYTEDSLMEKILQIQARQQDVVNKLQSVAQRKADRAAKKAQADAAAANA